MSLNASWPGSREEPALELRIAHCCEKHHRYTGFGERRGQGYVEDVVSKRGCECRQQYAFHCHEEEAEARTTDSRWQDLRPAHQRPKECGEHQHPRRVHGARVLVSEQGWEHRR